MGKKILLRLTCPLPGQLSQLHASLHFLFWLDCLFVADWFPSTCWARDTPSTQVSFVVSCSLAASMGLQPLIGMLTDRVSNRVVTGFSLLLAGRLWGVVPVRRKPVVCGVVLQPGAGPCQQRQPGGGAQRHPFQTPVPFHPDLGHAGICRLFPAGRDRLPVSVSESMYLFFALSVLLCALGLAGTRDEKGPAARGEGSSPGGKGRILSRPFLSCTSWWRPCSPASPG